MVDVVLLTAGGIVFGRMKVSLLNEVKAEIKKTPNYRLLITVEEPEGGEVRYVVDPHNLLIKLGSS